MISEFKIWVSISAKTNLECFLFVRLAGFVFELAYLRLNLICMLHYQPPKMTFNSTQSILTEFLSCSQAGDIQVHETGFLTLRLHRGCWRSAPALALGSERDGWPKPADIHSQHASKWILAKDFHGTGISRSGHPGLKPFL